MRATILTIGDEILIGQITDTNATYMAAALSDEGIEVVEHLSVSDSRMGIMSGLDRALQQSDIVLMSGGLGPTRDDITKQVLADYFGAELRLHTPTWKRLQKLYARHGREATEVHRQQCRLPTGAKVLTNERGTAPGLWMEKEEQIVVCMPGVPYEMIYLMDSEVMRRLKNQRFDADVLRSVTLLTAGAGESDIAAKLETFEDKLPENMSLAYLPNLGTVRLRLSARGQDEALLQSQLDTHRIQVEDILGELIYGYGTDDLASVVARHLQEGGKTLATAESCTGGMLGELITTHSGASAHYAGGVVAYSNALKVNLLGVPEATLDAHGAVSQETVTAMAEGARQRLGVDYALATSGIAGPTGGTADKPVGTIWIALATPDGTRTKLLRSGKDRSRNILYTSLQALNLLRLEFGPAPRPNVTAVPAEAAVVEPAPKPKRKPRAKKATEPKAAPKARTPAKSRTKKTPAPGPEAEPQPEAEKKPAPKARGRKKPSATKTEDAPAPKAPARGRRSARAKATSDEQVTVKAKTEKEPATETKDTGADAAKPKPKRRPLRKK